MQPLGAWMTRSLVRIALRGLSLAQIRHVTPVGFRGAPAGVVSVYRAVEREFGVLAPPVVLHAAAPEVMTATWVMLRETVLAPGLVDRATKEAVAAAVSLANECPYCVTVHSGTMNRLGDDRMEAVRAAATWPAPATGKRFPDEQLPEVLGVATALQYFNRMVAVFLTERPMPPFAPPWLLGPVSRMLTGLIAGAADDVGSPGGTLDLLPDAPLPGALSWAAGHPVVAGALARTHATLDATPVPASVRTLVNGALSTWDGRPKGPSRAWAWDAADLLAPDDRAAGRLALLTAFAPYQVDADVIRNVQADDRTLIQLTAWASMAAAVRASSLVHLKSPIWRHTPAGS